MNRRFYDGADGSYDDSGSFGERQPVLAIVGASRAHNGNNDEDVTALVRRISYLRVGTNGKRNYDEYCRT